MKVTCYSRYGHCSSVEESNLDGVMSDLLAELKTERFDEPDDEHTQVSIGNEHYAVTAQVSGLITFDNLDLLEGIESRLPESMYLRDIPDEDLKAIWWAVAHQDEKVLFAFPWLAFAKLPSHKRDFYRSAA